MKRFSVTPLALSALLISACAAKSNINWLIPESQRLNYAAVPEDSIVMFRQDRGDSIPQLGVPLAATTVSTDDGLGNLTGTLREEAGRIGANLRYLHVTLAFGKRPQRSEVCPRVHRACPSRQYSS